MARFEDLTGQRFERLTVVGLSEDKGKGKKPVTKWICRCECGKITTVKGGNLISGTTVSCGCKKRRHGLANKERLYQTWKNMRQRCSNPNRHDYKRYGGKGVSICREWDEYTSFRRWALSSGYDDTLSIDRIDVNGNYCPENCRWVDMGVQANNTSRNHIIELNGIKKTMAEWSEELGLSYSAIQHRLERGWSAEEALTTPQRAW